MKKYKNATENNYIPQSIDNSVLTFSRGDNEIISALSGANVIIGNEIVINFPKYWLAEKAKATVSYRIQSLYKNTTIRYLFDECTNRPSCTHTQNMLTKLLDPVFKPYNRDCKCYKCQNGWINNFEKI